jgi:hypothetical protein
LVFLGVPVKMPLMAHVDNIGAIFMSENPSSSSRTRHMSMRYFYVMDLQNDKVIILKFIRLAENLADIMTKNVPVQVHEQHINKVTDVTVPPVSNSERWISEDTEPQQHGSKEGYWR